MVTRARDPGPHAREIPHTADVGFEVDAPDLGALFERAGLGLLGVMADLHAVDARERRALALEADGLEALLHDWLQALLVVFEADRFAIAELGVEAIDAHRVAGFAGGEPIDAARHRLYTEVKGVTYHQLAIRRTAAGWWARFILDV